MDCFEKYQVGDLSCREERDSEAHACQVSTKQTTKYLEHIWTDEATVETFGRNSQHHIRPDTADQHKHLKLAFAF